MAIFRPIPSKKESTVDDTAVYEKLKDLEHHLRNRQFNNARATLRSVLNDMAGVKNYNIQLLNTITSIEEGQATGDLSLTAANRELREAFVLYRTNIEKVLNSLRIPTQEEQLRSLDGGLNLSGEVLLSFETARKSIKDHLSKRGVVLTTAPVLALTSPGLDVEKLRRSGFKAKSLEGYTVLLEQVVVGVSTDVVMQRLSTDKKVKEGGQRLPGTTPEQRAEVKEEFLDTVLLKFKNLKLARIGNEVIFEGASWFWLVPSDHLKLWRSCTTSPTTVNSLSIREWGFPFKNI